MNITIYNTYSSYALNFEDIFRWCQAKRAILGMCLNIQIADYQKF